MLSQQIRIPERSRGALPSVVEALVARPLFSASLERAPRLRSEIRVFGLGTQQ
jgi:hypothetical protein